METTLTERRTWRRVRLSLVRERADQPYALQLAVAAIVVAHNHSEDRAVTEAGELLGVELLDHVVIGADRCFSFADESYAAPEVR